MLEGAGAQRWFLLVSRVAEIKRTRHGNKLHLQRGFIVENGSHNTDLVSLSSLHCIGKDDLSDSLPTWPIRDDKEEPQVLPFCIDFSSSNLILLGLIIDTKTEGADGFSFRSVGQDHATKLLLPTTQSFHDYVHHNRSGYQEKSSI